MTRKWASAGLSLLLTVILLIGCAQGTQNALAEAQGFTPNAEDQQAGLSESDGEDLFIAPAPGESPTVQSDAQQALSAAKRTEGADLYVAVIIEDESQIHPLKCTQRDFYNLNALVFEGLIELDDTLKPVPLLADRWTVDGDEWTFTLRSGVKFHNGSLLSAADVVASFTEMMKHPDTMWYQLAECITSMRAEDDLTIVVTSNGVGEMLLYAMTFPIVQRDTIESALPKGTGPYWYIDYSVGDYLRIESNSLWWKRSSEVVNTIVACCYRSTTEAMAAVDSGEVDAIATRSTAAALSRSLNDRMTIDYSTQTYECVVPNLKNSVLKDLSIRQALMYAIDRTTLANSAYLGMVQESEVPVTPGSWIYDAQATRFNYSPERAYPILLDEGWADVNGDGILEKDIGGVNVEFRLTLITYNEGTSPVRTEAAYAIAEQLGKIGIAVDVQTGTLDQVKKKMTDGDFDLALISYSMSQMPNLAFMLSSSGSANYSKYQSAEMDEYLKAAYTAQTETELIGAMSKIQMTVVNELPILGLFFRNGVLISKININGLHGLRGGNVLRGIESATLMP